MTARQEELRTRRVEARERRRRRRAAVMIGAPIALAATLAGAWIGSSDDDGNNSSEKVASESGPELPRGGRRIFPRYRVVAFDGAPDQPDLGPLGRNSPAEAVRKLERQARPYETEARPVLPAIHLIAVVAQADAGDDGKYRARLEETVLRRYLAVAREAEMLLLLDIQPGQSSFVEEVRRLEPLLREPEVGIALDPEWNMEPGEVPGSTIGSVDAREVNDVSTFMQEIAAREDLPEKVLLVHQFTPFMVTSRGRITDRPRVAVAFSIDGFGAPELKRGVYRRLAPRNKRSGFKVFYEEDVPRLTPRDVLRLRPQPRVIVYE